VARTGGGRGSLMDQNLKKILINKGPPLCFLEEAIFLEKCSPSSLAHPFAYATGKGIEMCMGQTALPIMFTIMFFILGVTFLIH
jgi:hypothetical protein